MGRRWGAIDLGDYNPPNHLQMSRSGTSSRIIKTFLFVQIFVGDFVGVSYEAAHTHPTLGLGVAVGGAPDQLDPSTPI